MAIDDVTNGEIVRRVESLHEDLRHMSNTFVRTELYESQRQESGRRVGDVEHNLAALRSSYEGNASEADRRYRTTVNLFIGGAISFAGGMVLLIVSVIAK